MILGWQKMQGLYRITLGDKVYEYKNVITDIGRLGLLYAISGQRLGWATSIVAGIGNTAAASTDTGLEYLISGGDISTTIIDPVNEKLYFKSALPLQDEFKIYELGCYSSNTLSTQSSESGGGALIAILTSASNWNDTTGTHSLDTTNNRVGKDSIAYTISASASAEGHLDYIADLTSIPSNASFKFAYYVTGITDLVMRFKVDDSNYYEYDGWSVSNGYHISTALKSSFTSTGSPTWDQIQSIQIEITAGGSGGSVSLDAIRYELPLTTDSTLLSRVVLPTPQEKLPGVPLDIEYLLEI
jgi:hypothetical protein